MPALRSTYSVLVRTLGHAPRRPSGEDLAVLENALRLFPQDAQLAYEAATLHQRLGDPEGADAIIARAAAFSESDRDRELLAGFAASRGKPAR
jgi:hypothetical protein